MSPEEPQKGGIVVANVASTLAELSNNSHKNQKQTFKIIKPVAAAYGDNVCRYDRKVFINEIFFTYAFLEDRNEHQLPAWQGCKTLSKNELFLFSKHPNSFDSRYFGVIDKNKSIKILPLLTFSSTIFPQK